MAPPLHAKNSGEYYSECNISPKDYFEFMEVKILQEKDSLNLKNIQTVS